MDRRDEIRRDRRGGRGRGWLEGPSRGHGSMVDISARKNGRRIKYLGGISGRRSASPKGPPRRGAQRLWVTGVHGRGALAHVPVGANIVNKSRILYTRRRKQAGRCRLGGSAWAGRGAPSPSFHLGSLGPPTILKISKLIFLDCISFIVFSQCVVLEIF